MEEKRLGIGERIRGQQYQTAERQAQEEFQSAQAQASRDAAAEQARLQRELDVKLADMDRSLKERQIDIAQKELDLNTKISLENIKTRDGSVSDDVLQRLKDAGLDVDWFVSGKKPQSPEQAPAPAISQKQAVETIKKEGLKPEATEILKSWKMPEINFPGMKFF